MNKATVLAGVALIWAAAASGLAGYALHKGGPVGPQGPQGVQGQQGIQGQQGAAGTFPTGVVMLVPDSLRCPLGTSPNLDEVNGTYLGFQQGSSYRVCIVR